MPEVTSAALLEQAFRKTISYLGTNLEWESPHAIDVKDRLRGEAALLALRNSINEFTYSVVLKNLTKEDPHRVTQSSERLANYLDECHAAYRDSTAIAAILAQHISNLERHSFEIIDELQQIETGTSRFSNKSRSFERRLIAQHAAVLIQALQEVVDYNPRFTNRPPPDLWIDDDIYLSEIKHLVQELRRLNGLLANQNAPRSRVNTSLNRLYARFDIFFDKLAASMGTNIGRGAGVTVGIGAAALLIGGVAALFHYAGMGDQLTSRLLDHCKLLH